MDYIKFAEVVGDLVLEAQVSKTEMLRGCMELIEAAFQRGVTRKAILAALKICGLEMSMATFESALHRIRKEKVKSSRPSSSSSPALHSSGASTRREKADHTAAQYAFKNSLSNLLEANK